MCVHFHDSTFFLQLTWFLRRRAPKIIKVYNYLALSNPNSLLPAYDMVKHKRVYIFKILFFTNGMFAEFEVKVFVSQVCTYLLKWKIQFVLSAGEAEFGWPAVHSLDKRGQPIDIISFIHGYLFLYQKWFYILRIYQRIQNFFNCFLISLKSEQL